VNVLHVQSYICGGFHDCSICCTVKITAASTVHFVHNYVSCLSANFDAFIHLLNNSVLLHILATALYSNLVTRGEI